MKIKEAILQHMVSHLLQMCQTELEIEHLPPIMLVDEPCIHSNGKNTFGEFNGHTIKVVTMNRHPIDVLRTLAHELVHWKQQSEHMEMDGSDGSETENQANAVAGIILRRFSEKYPEYFIDSLP